MARRLPYRFVALLLATAFFLGTFQPPQLGPSGIALANGPSCNALAVAVQPIGAREIESDPATTALLRQVFAARDRDALLTIVRKGRDVRRALGTWIQNELQLRSKEVVARIQRHNTSESEFDAIIVGAGYHSAVLASILSAMAPTPQAMQRILIVDQAPVAVSAFYGQNFRVNSPELPNGQSTNPLTGGLVELNDFAAREGTVEADDFALPPMIDLLASGAPIALNVAASQLRPGETSGESVSLRVNDRNLGVKNFKVIAAATGLGIPNITSLDPSSQQLAEREMRSNANRAKLENGIYWYPDAMRILAYEGQQSNIQPGLSVAGKHILIIGGGHSGFISAEQFLGSMVTADGRPMPKTAASVTLIGNPATSSQQFAASVRPKVGTPQFQESIVRRYVDFGIGEAIDSGNLRMIGGRGTRITPAGISRYRVSSADADMNVLRQHEADIVILATGHDSEATVQALVGANPSKPANLELVVGTVFRNRATSTEPIARQLMLDPSAVPAGSAPTRQVYIFGPGANLPNSPEAASRSITGVPVSVNYSEPRTVSFADWLGRQLWQN